MFEHEGPWTEDAYLALRAGPAVPDARVELVDGSLLISPAAGAEHTGFVDRLHEMISVALPAGLALVRSVALRVAPGRILLADLVVVVRPGEGTDTAVRDAADVLQVIEVVRGGRYGTDLVDRVIKPKLYAEAGIPYHLRVEDEGPAAVAHLLIGGRYLEHVRAGPGEPLRLEDPFPVTIDLAAPAAVAAD